jgi:hypothetical protein
MSFFPSDLEIANAQSPLDILSEAKNEWDTKGQGIVTLLVDEGRPASQGDSDLTLIHVYALHIPSERVESLLTVIYASGKPYPARINPEKDDIPEYLRKERFVPARKSGLMPPSILQAISEAIPAHTVTEEWVCESPDEFRKQLSKALTLGRVKSAITNIIAASGNAALSPDTSAQPVDQAREREIVSDDDRD